VAGSVTDLILRMMPTSLLFAHPRVIAWRNRLRQSSLARKVYSTISGRGGYEERFSRELLGAIHAGDTVWDVGANVGHYAAQFSDRGAAKVVCFEPAPGAVAALQGRFAAGTGADSRVQIVPVALGRQRSIAAFTADGASPDNQIVAAANNNTVEIQVYSGDEAQVEFALPSPNVIKIDVEGFELEVIQGLSGVLSCRTLRSVFIEVHFSLLHNRGLDAAPSLILRNLRDLGFQVHWVDPSHLGARRP
jgi:FkbM family methyltransferase